MGRARKLDDGQRWILRRDYREGAQPKALAIKYGVSEATVSLILHPEAYAKKLQYGKERYRQLKEDA